MKSPTNISTLPFEAPKRKLNVHHLLWAVLFIGFCVGAYTIVADATKEALDTVHKDGVAVGYQLAINLNVPTVEGCMKFYFNDDPKRVATAVQTLCKGKS